MIGFPETSVRNYHSTMRKIPEERRYRLHRGRNLNSRNVRLEVSTEETEYVFVFCKQNSEQRNNSVKER